MKTVLFAVDHMTPDQKALDYALTLCRRMLARLDVLHIIQSPENQTRYLETIKSKVRLARDAFENAMVKATFAEAGVRDPESVLKAAAYDQFRRVLPKDANDDGFDYHCVVTGEAAGAVIERYVHGHRNVVLTVFDPQPQMSSSADTSKVDRATGGRVMPKLAIPLVRVKNAQ
jgi:hypothetical protein